MELLLHTALGCEARFLYPKSGQNRARLAPELELRRVLVHAARDTFTKPVTDIAFEHRPDLRRSSWLVTCWDLSRKQWRSFYEGSVRELTVLLKPDAQERALSERKYNILEAMVKAKITSADQRRTTAEIAKLSDGPHASADCFKHPIAGLVEDGLLGAKAGRGGGCWVTREGLRFVRGLGRG